MRSDGRANALALISALLSSCDIRTGCVKYTEHGHLDHAPLTVMDVRAYGPTIPHARSLRRSERHLRNFACLGLITLQERAEQRRSGAWVAKASIKRVNSILWTMLGLGPLYAIHLGHAEAKRKAAAADDLAKTLAAVASDEKARQTPTVERTPEEVERTARVAAIEIENMRRILSAA